MPGVGANLQDHLQIRSVFRSRAHPLNTRAAHWWGKGGHRPGVPAASHRADEHGALAARGLCALQPRQPWANLQFHVQPLSLDAFGEPLHRFNAFTASVCNLNPSSRGSVRAALQ